MNKLHLIIVLLTIGLAGFSQTTWTGTTSNDWVVDGNWSAGVPDAADAVTIPTGSTVNINDGTAAVALSITINAGSSVLTIKPGGSLTTGEIDNAIGAAGLVIESVTSATQGNLTGSLIYNNAGTEPDATVQVYVKEQAWHFVSSPVGNTTANVFLSQTDDVWLTRFTAGQEWKYLVDPDTIIDKGLGYAYAINFSAGRDDNNLGFTGKLVSQLFTKDLEFSDDSDPENDYNLVGNPFSAPINIALLPPVETDIELSIWIWDQTLNGGSGGYQWASFFNTYPPPLEMDPPVIAIGQGFFVRALQVGAQVNFNPNLRDHTSAVKFFKNTENKNNDLNFIRVTITNNQRSDYGEVGFGDNGTNGFDNGYDVSKMFGSEDVPHVYFVAEGNNYCRNHLQTLQLYEEHIVDMHFVAGEDGEQTLEADLEYLTDMDVYLEDQQTDYIFRLNDNPVYTFDASTADDPNRFKLYFAYSPTGVEGPAETNFNIYAFQKAIYIANNGNNSAGIANVEIYDLYGRSVMKTNAATNNLTRIPVNVQNTYLIVRVVTGGETFTKKVFIH